mmetsp:Transcript_90907/g.246521  ORF Transcript_90907/g.246521 Transcript_90907/m.246521 type:complete len:133 (+) Transcript_90907:548-946(+)
MASESANTLVTSAFDSSRNASNLLSFASPCSKNPGLARDTPMLSAPRNPRHQWIHKVITTIPVALATFTTALACQLFATCDASGEAAGAYAGPRRGVEDPEDGPEPGPMHSKSVHVPTRRHAKHHRVRQLSW